jgi:hypothetical protein
MFFGHKTPIRTADHEVRKIIVIELKKCREESWMDEESCGQPKRGPRSELEAGDDAVGGACAFNDLLDLILFYTQPSWLPNS